MLKYAVEIHNVEICIVKILIVKIHIVKICIVEICIIEIYAVEIHNTMCGVGLNMSVNLVYDFYPFQLNPTQPNPP